MALKLGDLLVDLKVNTKDAKKADKEIRNISKSMTKAFKVVGAAIAAAFTVQAIGKVILLADEMSVLERRIALISDNTVQASKNFSTLSKIATQTGQKISNVAKIFEGFKRIQSDIGATNEELLDFTASLNQLSVIGGSSAEETANALRQLNQGLAGGILRAEEFNSIIENTPEIAFGIARGLGKSLGELRAMVLDGKLLSKDVFGSILSQTEAIEERFNSIPKSMAQLFQGASNEMAIYVSRVTESLGITEAISDALESVIKKLQEANAANTALNETSKEEAERRIFEQLKFISTIDEQIGKQEEVIQFYKDEKFSVELVTEEERKLTKLMFERHSATQDLFAIQERIEELATEIVNDENKLVDVVERKNKAQERNLELMRLTNQEVRLAFTTAITKTVGPGGRRFAGAGGPDDPLEPQAFGDPDIENQVLTFLASLGDGNAQIELEARRHQDALSEITTFGAESRAQLEKEIDEKANAQKQVLFSNQIQFVGNALGQINSLMIASGKEGTRGQRAIAQAQALIQAQQIIAAGLLGAEKAAAFSAAAGPFAALASKQAIIGSSVISAGIVAGMSFGGGRQFGGNVSPNSITPINESGDPEVMSTASGQFLLTGSKGGRITGSNDLSGGNGGGVNITIINQVPGIVIEDNSVSRTEIMMIVKRSEDSAVSRVNRSISTNQGDTASALESAGIARRI